MIQQTRIQPKLKLIRNEHRHIPIIRILDERAGEVLMALCCTHCDEVIDKQWMKEGMRCLAGIEF